MTEIRSEAHGGDSSQQLAGRTKLKWGKVKETFPERAQCTVMMEDMDGVESFRWQVLFPNATTDKFYWMPKPDDQVMCFFDEGSEEGYILAGFYNEQVPLPIEGDQYYHVTFEDGSWLQYDKELHKLTASLVPEGSEIEISATKITLRAREIEISADEFQIDALTRIDLLSPANTFRHSGLPVAVFGAVDNAGDLIINPNQQTAGDPNFLPLPTPPFVPIVEEPVPDPPIYPWVGGGTLGGVQQQ